MFSKPQVPITNQKNKYCPSYSSTRGNSSDGYMNKKAKKIEQIIPEQEKSFEEVVKEIDELSYCCAYGGSLGCIKRTFLAQECRSDVSSLYNLDINQAVATVRRCQGLTVWREKHNLNDFVLEIFRASISKAQETSDGLKYVMDYRIDERKYPVCRTAFAKAYGISKHKLDQASERLKEVTKACCHKPFKVSHRPFTDATVHELNYVETERIFSKNTCASVGKAFKIFFPIYIIFVLQIRKWCELLCVLHRKFKRIVLYGLKRILKDIRTIII